MNQKKINNRKVQLESGSIELCNGSYIKMVLSDYLQMTITELKKRESVIIELCQDRPMPFVIDTRDKFIDYLADARDYIANKSQIAHLRQAEAFITNSIGIRLILNNHMKMNPNQPAKIFETEKDALEWISQFTDEE